MITKNLSKLLEHDVVYVTGPQRSGTTFVSNYLAKTLGYKLIDEDDYQINKFSEMKGLISKSGKCVVQCPAQSHNILKFPGGIVVFMMRDIYDIINSEIRIDWNKSGARDREYDKYKTHFAEYTKELIPISAIKYKVWEEVQKPHLRYYIELIYDDLSVLDEWVQKKDREHFKNKQIQ